MTRHVILTINVINVDSFTTVVDPPLPFWLDWKRWMVDEKNVRRSFKLVSIFLVMVVDSLIVVEVKVRFDMVWF